MRRSNALLAVLVLAATSFRASAEPVLDDSSADAIRAAIEKNWTIPLGIAHLERCTASLRLHLTREGIVTQIDVLEDNNDPDCRTVAASARRAVLITQSEDGRLPLPTDKFIQTIILRWPMRLICEQASGC